MNSSLGVDANIQAPEPLEKLLLHVPNPAKGLTWLTASPFYCETEGFGWEWNSNSETKNEHFSTAFGFWCCF